MTTDEMLSERLRIALGDLPRLVKERVKARAEADAASAAARARGCHMLPEEAAAVGRFADAHRAVCRETERVLERLETM
jgi:hypothetical protein